MIMSKTQYEKNHPPLEIGARVCVKRAGAYGFIFSYGVVTDLLPYDVQLDVGFCCRYHDIIGVDGKYFDGVSLDGDYTLD